MFLLSDDFDDLTSLENPIFKIMAQQDQMLGSSITEEEIQNHKNKLKNLISNLINTHNIDEETSINNDIKNETEFLSSLFKIKKNELNKNMNNMNINPIQQPMMDQQMVQQQMMAQQHMMQQQMMQQQMMAAQQAQAQQAMQNILNNQINNGISVVFRQANPNYFPKIEPIRIYDCYPEQKVSSIIEKYRTKSGDYDVDRKFIFNAKNLSPYLSLAEAGILNNANIFVVKTKKDIENK